MTATPIHPRSRLGTAIFWSTAPFTLIGPPCFAHRALRWWRAVLERMGLLAGRSSLNFMFDTLEFELLTRARPEEALSVIEKRISLEPEAWYPLLQAGRICEQLRRPRDAAAFYEHALGLNAGPPYELAAYVVTRVTTLKAEL